MSRLITRRRRRCAEGPSWGIVGDILNKEFGEQASATSYGVHVIMCPFYTSASTRRGGLHGEVQAGRGGVEADAWAPPEVRETLLQLGLT